MKKVKTPLTLEGARALSDADAIEHVKVIATPDGLTVEINGTFVVANRAREVRHFAKSDTCFGWLFEIGIRTIHEVDLSGWEGST